MSHVARLYPFKKGNMRPLEMAIFLSIAVTCCHWNSAWALEKLDCQHSGSIYCNNTWQGASLFSKAVHKMASEVTYQDAFRLDDPSSQLLIWIKPPRISTQDLMALLEKGTNIIAFDESSTSLQWYREILDPFATSQDSPLIPNAAHINGNPALPVMSPLIGDFGNLKFSQKTYRYQLAFNHPSPVMTQSQKITQFHTGFVIQNKHSQTSGSIVVIRDESFWTNLMFYTLDNSAFLNDIFEALCQNSCTIGLFEPKFAFLKTIPDDNSIENENIEPFREKLAQSRQAASEFIEQHQDEINKIPWSSFLYFILAIWVLAAIVAIFPLKRSS